MSNKNNSTSSRSNSGLLVKQDGLEYQTGFGNAFESECLAGALPQGRNNPRVVPYNLYAEQLSGTAFTSPRYHNRRTWLYRIQPSAANFVEVNDEEVSDWNSSSQMEVTPKPLRWKPLPEPVEACDFVMGMKLMAKSGCPTTKSGLAIYMYGCNQSMSTATSHMINADGDFLILPQQMSLSITTEVGCLIVHPNEICVIPRGLVFSVNLLSNEGKEERFARGYILEIFAGHFQLPELGPIGSNGLANARDFLYPVASCQQDPTAYRQEGGTLHRKFASKLFSRALAHSPYNVVAWHGNYLPFKYDLTNFCAVNSVTYDHLDPSIYTVLTCPSSAEPGTALADFVIFPPRIMATDSNTLRPPWFHRNTMTEFMGLIQGNYDAKEGFQAGGASLHSCMTPHGPDRASYNKAVQDDCEFPVKFEGGLAFMFETSHMLEIHSDFLSSCSHLDRDYESCWKDLSSDNFTGWDSFKGKK